MLRHYTLAEALTYGHGTERPFLCPVHGDSRPSASVNMIKRVWVCYTCGAHGGLTGEHALMEPDYEQMREWFNDRMEEGRVYPEGWLTQYDAGDVHEYWLDRVGERAARHFRLGADRESGAVVYPLRDPSGGVLGVVRRPLRGEGPKYLYPKGVDVGSLLFNYTTDARRVVVLCEGALDAIALWNVGVQAMAIYGCRLSVEQVRLVDRLDPLYVYTAYDNDEAGEQAHRETERSFSHRFVARLRWPRSWGKDVGELSEERLKKVVLPLESATQSCVGSETWPQTSASQDSTRLQTKMSVTC